MPRCSRLSALSPLVSFALLAASFGPVPGPARAAEATAVPILPLSQVRAGMTGYGLTVFSGTRPERFDVRVIGVLHHFLPKQDIFLVQSDDPRLLHSGIAAGMSGSPIYLGGKLAGALAYGWGFSKDPVAGVTPIESMLVEVRRPQRGRDHTALAQAPVPVREDATDGSGRPWSLARLLPPSPPSPLAGADPRLVRAAVPLSVAGMSAGAFAELTSALSPFHITPLQAGGAARPGARGPERFEPGGAIAVELIRGDISAAGTGTVTYVEGSKVAGFGHPMFNVGEVYFPIATAEVLTFLSSLSQSFKMSAPLEMKGSLVQDRQSCIVGDTGEVGEMIPLKVAVTGPGRTDHLFATEVARHRFLTPLLAASVANSATQTAAPDVADAVIQVHSRVGVQGFSPLEQTDFVFSSEGLNAKSVLLSTGMRQVNELLFNPFAPVRIDRIDLDISVDYRADVAELLGLALASDELEPGTRPSLYVTLRPYNGKPYVRAVPFDVPRSLAGQTIKIEASAGNLARPEVAPPENLRDLVENLRKGYPARSLVLTLTIPDEGVTLRGHLVPSLPASVIATLRPGASTRRADPYKRLSRFVVDMGGVIQGRQELTVRVRDELK